MVLPRRCSSRKIAIISMCGKFSPLAGSSSKSNCGSWMSTRARPSRCCMPRLNAPINAPFFSDKPTSSKTSLTVFQLRRYKLENTCRRNRDTLSLPCPYKHQKNPVAGTDDMADGNGVPDDIML